MNKYVLLKVLSVFVASISQILLKISANKDYKNRFLEYFNPFVIIGYFLFFVSSLLSVFSMRGITVSLSSIIESISYIVIPVLGFSILGERINKKQLFGMIIIILGVFLFNL